MGRGLRISLERVRSIGVPVESESGPPFSAYVMSFQSQNNVSMSRYLRILFLYIKKLRNRISDLPKVAWLPSEFRNLDQGPHKLLTSREAHEDVLRQNPPGPLMKRQV